MLYLLCILCPPLAVLLAGRPGAAILNVILTCLFWIPGMIHAFAVVGETKAEKRTQQLVGAIRAQGGGAPVVIQQSPRKSIGIGGVIVLGIFLFFLVRIVGKTIVTQPPTAPTTTASATR